jgi:hypothetical protein
LKIASGVMLCVFVLSVVVQLNDPDPLRWVVIYGIAAALSGLAMIGRFLFWPSAIACVIYGAGIVLLWDAAASTTMQALSSIGMKDLEEEHVREFWGLALCLGWSIVLLLKARRSPTPRY